ncbi:YveK family protein [Ureibacillus acetophenoni]|uniref:Capsular polysaccharide biosynthesis protein n=1 Tax=Ureibacillus acetophenoni TaxID=614649 RepID=A0A285U9G1_9BACL|nr:Wzz/FepE/Etk N-terminal domain-containing protein [Ureibacillus acetophenoni]SOC38472.1 capsular polysaccharide biosynthesis protein [Ureibacillus acetophenoni]
MGIIELICVFKRRFWFMFFISICFSGLIIFIAMYLVKPTYEYTVQVMVGISNNVEKGEISSKVDENRQLATSITDIIQSPHIAEEVSEQLNLNQSGYELLKLLSVKNRENSQVISITVKNSDAHLTKAIAFAIAKQSINNFREYANDQLIYILNDSNSNREANLIFPKPVFVIIISLILGIFAGIGMTLFRESIDDRIYNIDEIEQLGIPILGRVRLKMKNNKKWKYYKLLSLEEIDEEIGIVKKK